MVKQWFTVLQNQGVKLVHGNSDEPEVYNASTLEEYIETHRNQVQGQEPEPDEWGVLPADTLPYFDSDLVERCTSMWIGDKTHQWNYGYDNTYPEDVLANLKAFWQYAEPRMPDWKYNDLIKETKA
jgi:hypothetical protein